MTRPCLSGSPGVSRFRDTLRSEAGVTFHVEYGYSASRPLPSFSKSSPHPMMPASISRCCSWMTSSGGSWWEGGSYGVETGLYENRSREGTG